MLVTVFCAPRDRPETTFALDVSPELELRDFVALCEIESGIPAGEIQITYVEQPLKDPTRALGNYGVKDGDVVVLRQADRRPPPTQPAFPGLPHIDFRSISVPGTSNSNNQRSAVRPPQPPSQQPQPQQPLPQPQPQPQLQQRNAQPSTPMAFRGSSSQGLDDPALLQQMLLANPHELALLKERNPPLAEALLSGDLERFTKVLLEQQQDRAKREQERIRLLTADPFDLDAQAKIEEEIRQHNVEENMTIAMEEAPESFGQVVMLYINCKVNGHPVKAFVDSGAQMTIMSQACAERCNIMRLVDRRWAGIAKGVGTQKIIGRVHLAQVQIEGDFLPCSFSILEDQPMDMLLGLDMLKRHQCSIDLKKNVLLIGTTGTETRFLSEAELPECARLAYGAEGREEARPEEMADRELAEALQRSIQESDTADGQPTSPQPPTPLTLPKTLDQMSSTCSEAPLGQTSLYPDDTASAAGQSQDHPGPVEPFQSHNAPSSDQPDIEPVVTIPIKDAPPTPELQDEEITEIDNGLEEVVSSTISQQPMEHECGIPSEGAPNQSDSVDMESSSSANEREDPEIESRARSNSIPSLAAALKELHELIVSNKHNQNRSASCSPTFTSDSPETCQPEASTSTAITQPSDAKVNHPTAADAVSDEGHLERDPHELSGLEDNIDLEFEGEPLEGQKFEHCLSGADHRGQDEISKNTSIFPSEPEVSPSCARDNEFREHLDGKQDAGVKEERASSNNSPQTVSPLSMEAVESQSAPGTSPPRSFASPVLTPSPPGPQTVVGPFPVEHIQRIQAAGFSAQEAVEALGRAHGVVEIALLALLARSITVPR